MTKKEFMDAYEKKVAKNLDKYIRTDFFFYTLVKYFLGDDWYSTYTDHDSINCDAVRQIMDKYKPKWPTRLDAFKRKILKKHCLHRFIMEERSNAIQFDDIGYPLRLCICRCSKCGITEQKWLVDTQEDIQKEIESGKSFVLNWKGD